MHQQKPSDTSFSLSHEHGSHFLTRLHDTMFCSQIARQMPYCKSKTSDPDLRPKHHLQTSGPDHPNSTTRRHPPHPRLPAVCQLSLMYRRMQFLLLERLNEV